jgi:hypothetical protein
MYASISRSRILCCASSIGVLCLVALSSLPQPKIIEVPRTATEFNSAILALGLGEVTKIAFALGIDFLFIACYVTAIGLGCTAIADRTTGMLSRLGMLLAYLQLATGVVDSIENVSLIRLMISGFEPDVMGVARLATASKFAIPIAGLLYIIIVGLIIKMREHSSRMS